ncbi:phage integrase SAM-like domain-containing protein [Limibacterium fermenti]|uniref:phage integrase SAM-like domain-containing protein n=1 Tax=Limibacterium fermenti TaxID=3229863 RepID=UPI003A723A7F
MATLKLAVVPAKVLKNGKHKIRIAVSHKQDTRYIVQRFVIDNLKQFKNGQVVNRADAGIINRKLREELNKYQDTLDKIDPDVYSCSQLRDFLVKNSKIKTLTISQAADMHIAKLKKISAKEDYTRTKNYFITSCGDIPLEMITPEVLRAFEAYLKDTRGNNSTTRGIHMRQLKSFITPQIKNGNVNYKIKPFDDIEMPESLERDLDITIEEFKKIRDSQFKGKPLRVARDLFCLSYYLGGINLIDLMNIDFREKDTVDYIREKSRNMKKGDKRISLTIQPEAKEIINRWIGINGKLDFGYKYEYENFRRYVTNQIKRLSQKLGINKRVVYYSARKSLVQHGFDLGISLEILEYSIGQSVKKNRPIFNYVRIMRSHADTAMRTILDNLKKDERE